MTTIVSYGTNQYLFGLLVEPVSRELRMDKASIGLAYSGVVLVAGFAGLVLGHALDRFGARMLLSAGSLLSGVSLLRARAHEHTLLAFDRCCGRSGIGLGTALTYYPVTMTVVANWFDRSRTRALSLLTFMGAFSSTITYPIAGALIAHAGWRTCVAVLGARAAPRRVPLHALVVRRHPEDLGLLSRRRGERGAVDARERRRRTAPRLRSAAFWLPTAAIALAYFASTAVLLAHVAYLIHAATRRRSRRPSSGSSAWRICRGAGSSRGAPSASASRRCSPATFVLEALGIALLASCLRSRA